MTEEKKTQSGYQTPYSLWQICKSAQLNGSCCPAPGRKITLQQNQKVKL